MEGRYRPTKRAVVESIVMALILLGILLYCLIPSRGAGESYLTERLERALLMKALSSGEEQVGELWIAKKIYLVMRDRVIEIEKPKEVKVFENMVRVKWKDGVEENILIVPIREINLISTDIRVVGR